MIDRMISKPTIHGSDQSRQSGFTLIELMITVAIVGILSAIAYPSYQESVRKGRRADALRTAVEAEQYMRRFYSARDTYNGVTLPTALTKSPKEGGAAYNVKFLIGTTLKDTSEEASTFTLRITRAGSMSNDRCGDLQINQSGKRELMNNATGSAIKDCFPGS